MKKTWFNLQQKAADVLDLLIYGVIGQTWDGKGVSAQVLVEQLTSMRDVKTINVHLNSPGGQVFEGIAIYNTLANHPATVNIAIDGMAASIATVIAMAGNKISIAENAMMMIHEAEGGAFGRASDLRKTAEAMDKANAQIALTYANKTGKTSEELLAMMTAETWMTGAEAKTLGFVDEVTAPMRLAAQFDVTTLDVYRNVPEQFKAMLRAAAEEDVGRPLDLVRRELDVLSLD